MNLDFSEEQKAAAEELRRLLADHPGLKSSRAALESRAAFDRTLWQRLGELGWLGVAIPRQYGGQGLGREMLCGVAREIGRSMAAVPFGPSILIAAEAVEIGGTQDQQRAYLPALASGRSIGALAIAESVGALTPHAIRASFDKGRLTGTKIAVSDGMISDLLIVVARHGGEHGLFVIQSSDAGVHRELQAGIDPGHAPARIRFEAARAEPLSALGGWGGVRRLLERAAVPVAFEQVGAADAALEMATEYAKTRRAFGRLIGSFQAVKHKLADVFIATELARANGFYAAWALQANAASLSLAAATARVSATEALERAARELIQVHGGIGVTWEHDCHLFYRRAQYFGGMLGGLREWQDRLAEQLQHTGLETRR
jgi:alkylation response protein AidB-like acyl-CoA dehydrogenase